MAAWALAQGRTCDLNATALCLEVLERHTASTGIRLDRSTVNDVVRSEAPNAATLLGTLVPESWLEALWTVLCWLDADGRLDPSSDPLGALLEPLSCAGGLGPDGRPMPDGTDVDFPCQCFLPHDPSCPPGLAQHIVGRHPDTWNPFVAHAHLRLRTEDPPLSTFAPLFALARQMRADGEVASAQPDEFSYLGRIDPQRRVPELWLYQHDSSVRWGHDPLVLDGDGRPWVPVPDRRRKAGFRWAPASTTRALLRCGAFGQREPRGAGTLTVPAG